MAHRRMRDPRLRLQREDSVRAPHVAHVNALVAELIKTIGRGWVPYAPPARQREVSRSRSGKALLRISDPCPLAGVKR